MAAFAGESKGSPPGNPLGAGGKASRIVKTGTSDSKTRSRVEEPSRGMQIVHAPESIGSCASESSRTSTAGAEGIHLGDLGSQETGEDELGDPLASLERDGTGAQVLEDDLQFAPVVGVDGSGAVREGDPVTERQSGAGPDLALHPRWELHLQAGGHRPDLPRLEDQVRLCRPHIVASRLRGRSLGQGKVGIVGQPPEADRREVGARGSAPPFVAVMGASPAPSYAPPAAFRAAHRTALRATLIGPAPRLPPRGAIQRPRPLRGRRFRPPRC